MLLPTSSLTDGPWLPNSPDECGLNLLSLFLTAGMHGLYSDSQLFIPLCLSIFFVITTTLTVVAFPSNHHYYSRRQNYPVTGSLTTNPKQSSAVINSSKSHSNQILFTVKASRGSIKKRSVDYLMQRAPHERVLILTNLLGRTLRMNISNQTNQSNLSVYGTKNSEPTVTEGNTVSNMLFHVLHVTRTVAENVTKTEFDNDYEIVIQSAATQKFVCMNTTGDVGSQKMENNSLPFDCIWRLHSFSIGTTIYHSYYPYPPTYMNNNSKRRKRWLLAINQRGFMRNGKKTKGRRDSSVWRFHSKMGLKKETKVYKKLVEINTKKLHNFVVSPRSNRSTNHRRMGTARILNGTAVAERTTNFAKQECMRIITAMKPLIRRDIHRSRKVLRSCTTTRENIVSLLRSANPHIKSEQLRTFRAVFNQWIYMHWQTWYTRKRLQCLKRKFQKLKVRKFKRKPLNDTQKYINQNIRNKRKTRRQIARLTQSLIEWRLVKKRLLKFLLPLTFPDDSRKSKRGRKLTIHRLIRQQLHFRLHSFKKITYAVYVNKFLSRSNDQLLVKYAEAFEAGNLTRRKIRCNTLWVVTPGVVRFPLQKWHRHLSCIKRFDQKYRIKTKNMKKPFFH